MSGVPAAEWNSVRQSVLYVMIYDFLFGKGIQGGGAVKRLIMKHKDRLCSTLTRLRRIKCVQSNAELLPKHLRSRTTNPECARYVRVNTLKINIKDKCLEQLIKTFGAVADEHIPNVLVFPPTTDLHDHELVKRGCLILQDKASCFPAHILMSSLSSSPSSENGSNESTIPLQGRAYHIIDACAAPGNKTSQLAALLQQASLDDEDNKGTSSIFAFDKDPKRLKLLERRMNEAGASKIVRASLQDFLRTNPRDERYRDVRAILLDPSCSGSGMRQRVERRIASATDTADMNEKDRVKKLASFQLKCLLHAFQFPAECITYSTCSTFVEENEHVVRSALQSLHDSKNLPSFSLERALPTWPRRGHRVEGLSESQSECLIRVDPTIDKMNGFFVACFRRRRTPGASTTRKRKRGRKKRKRLSSKRRRKLREKRSSSSTLDPSNLALSTMSDVRLGEAVGV